MITGGSMQPSCEVTGRAVEVATIVEFNAVVGDTEVVDALLFLPFSFLELAVDVEFANPVDVAVAFTVDMIVDATVQYGITVVIPIGGSVPMTVVPGETGVVTVATGVVLVFVVPAFVVPALVEVVVEVLVDEVFELDFEVDFDVVVELFLAARFALTVTFPV